LIGGIKSTLARPGKKLEHTERKKGRIFVSVRRGQTHVVFLLSLGCSCSELLISFSLSLSLSLSCVWSVVGTGVLSRYGLLSLSLSLSFSRQQNVAWVKSALWRHLSRSTFTRSRPFARWSRWPACYEIQLIWGLGDGNHSWMVVSLIFLLHSSCTLVFAFESEPPSKIAADSHWYSFWGAVAAGGKHSYLNIVLYVDPIT
jgi:hypothetical protein